MPELAGKTVVITGAAGGQGSEEAQLFARNGAHVLVADLNDEGGRAVVEAIVAEGSSAEYVRLDVASESDWQAVRDRSSTGVRVCTSW